MFSINNWKKYENTNFVFFIITIVKVPLWATLRGLKCPSLHLFMLHIPNMVLNYISTNRVLFQQ